MTLLEELELGEAGVIIKELLQDIKDTIHTDETRDMIFEDQESRKEYIDHTIEMIVEELTKLKAK